MDLINPQYLVNSLVFSLLGVIVFWISFVIIDKLTPCDRLLFSTISFHRS